jgi:hypothetical protein
MENPSPKIKNRTEINPFLRTGIRALPLLSVLKISVAEKERNTAGKLHWNVYQQLLHFPAPALSVSGSMGIISGTNATPAKHSHDFVNTKFI